MNNLQVNFPLHRYPADMSCSQSQCRPQSLYTCGCRPSQVFVGIAVRVTWILPVLLHHNGAPLSASLASSWWPVLLITYSNVSQFYGNRCTYLYLRGKISNVEMRGEAGDDVETESHPVASSVACSLYRVTVVAEGVAASLQCCVVVRAAILLQDRYVLMLLF